MTTVDDDISSGMNSLSLKSNLPHTLIVPIAVIGAGKSTLGSAMASLYNIGHIQSDNISGKKAGNKFVAAIVDWFLTKPDAATLFADKNNHLGEHRFTLITQFYKYFPNGRVVALYWNLDDMSFDHIIRVSSERVVKR